MNDQGFQPLLARIRELAALPHVGRRLMIALAGPPAAGKSTLAARLAEALGQGAKVVPMDGFHYDDRVLADLGLSARKGAPETFDLAGFAHLLTRLQRDESVAIPLFDRALELSRAGAEVIGPKDRILLVEGNYLLLNRPGWRDLGAHFALTVFVGADEDTLAARLRDRWRQHGRPDGEAWIETNDLPNVRIVMRESSPAMVSFG